MVIALGAPASNHPSTSLAFEDARIHDHLLRAELACRGRVHRTRDRATQLLRALMLDELRAYRMDGRFPRHHEDGLETPVFVDASGTHCAVGHLLAASGEHDLVARIARERNRALVPELADEPRLVRWLDAVGITLDEAARIQPQYCSTPASMLCGNCTWGSVSRPAMAIAEGYVVSTTPNGVPIIQVETVHGASPGVSPGSELAAYVSAEYGGGPVALGTSVLVVLDAEFVFDGGIAEPAPFARAVATPASGLIGCPGSELSVPVDVWVDAKLATSCEAVLGEQGRAWTHDTCSGSRGCATSDARTASVDVLLATVPILLGFTIARRERARRSRRGR